METTIIVVENDDEHKKAMELVLNLMSSTGHDELVRLNAQAREIEAASRMVLDIYNLQHPKTRTGAAFPAKIRGKMVVPRFFKECNCLAKSQLLTLAALLG